MCRLNCLEGGLIEKKVLLCRFDCPKVKREPKQVETRVICCYAGTWIGGTQRIDICHASGLQRYPAVRAIRPELVVACSDMLIALQVISSRRSKAAIPAPHRS